MLKKMSITIALGLVVTFLSIPAASFAGKGPGDGIPDLLCEHGVVVEGVCYPELGSITTQGNLDVAAGPNGSQSGDQDGIPDQDRLRDGSCLDNELTTQVNLDVAAGPNGSQSGDQDGIPDQDRLRDGSCLDNELTTQVNLDVAAGPNGPQSGDQDGDPDQDRLRDGSCLLDEA